MTEKHLQNQLFICTNLKIKYKSNLFNLKGSIYWLYIKTVCMNCAKHANIKCWKMIKIAFTWIRALSIKLLSIPQTFQWPTIYFILIGNSVCKTVYLHISNVNQALANFHFYFFFIQMEVKFEHQPTGIVRISTDN